LLATTKNFSIVNIVLVLNPKQQLLGGKLTPSQLQPGQQQPTVVLRGNTATTSSSLLQTKGASMEYACWSVRSCQGEEYHTGGGETRRLHTLEVEMGRT